MITSSISTSISADRESVWHALTTPSELIRWDDQLVALLDPVPDYPQVGQHAHWRYRVGSIELVTQQTIREIRTGERLQSSVSLGLFRFDEVYGLMDDAATPDHTRLTLRVVASNSVPLVGGLLDRFDVRRFLTDLIDSRLRGLQKWCENHP